MLIEESITRTVAKFERETGRRLADVEAFREHAWRSVDEVAGMIEDLSSLTVDDFERLGFAFERVWLKRLKEAMDG